MWFECGGWWGCEVVCACVRAQFAIGIIGDNVEVDVNGGSAAFRFGPANPGGVPEAPLLEVPMPVPVPVKSTPPVSITPSSAIVQSLEAEIARLRVSEAAARAEAAVLRADTYAFMPPDVLAATVERLRMLHSVASTERARRCVMARRNPCNCWQAYISVPSLAWMCRSGQLLVD